MTNEEQIKKWKKQLEEYDKKRIAELNEIRITPSVPITSSTRNKDADTSNFFGGLLGGLLPGSSIADAAIKSIREDTKLQQEAKKQGIDLNNLYTTQENLNMFGADVGRTIEATGAGISSALSNLGKGTLIAARNMGALSPAVDKAIADLRAGTKNAQVEELKLKAKEKGIDTITLDEYLNKAKNTKTSLERINDFSANTFDKWSNEANQRIAELQGETQNEFAKTAIGFMPNLSQQAVTIGASLINPVLGTSVATGQAMGSYYNDAKSRGMTDEQANDFSQIMGIVEGATEMIGVDKLIKAGKGAKALAKGGLNSARKELSKEVITSTFGNLLGGAMDNFMQEALTEPIQEGVADWIGGKGNWENIDQRMLEAGINGAITSLITGGANIGVQSAVGVASKTRNGQTATQQEVNQGLVDTLAEIDKLSKEEKQEFIDKYVTPGIETAQDVAKQGLNQTQNEQNQGTQTQISENAQQQVQEQEQQIVQQENENALKENVEPQNQEQEQEIAQEEEKLQKMQENLTSEQEEAQVEESTKEKQFKIIQENNPKDKNLSDHTWIENKNDIKTYQEAVDSDNATTPDFTEADMQKALDTGKVTVYSSTPIEQGAFVSPSKMEAQSYAGNGEIYSKEINTSDVAWIDSLQGQYAQISQQETPTFNDIDAETPQEFMAKRKDYIDKNMTIDDNYKDNISRGSLKAKVDGKIVGSLNYEINDNGQIEVANIHVNDDYRRLGIATKLYEQLQEKTPDQDIKFGELTEEGKKLLDSIASLKSKTNQEGFEEYSGQIRQVSPKEAPAQVPQVNEVKQRQVESTQPTTQQVEPVVSGEKGQRKTLGKQAQNQNLPQEFRDVADKLYKTNLYTKKKNSQLKTQAQDRISKVGADNLLTDLTEKTNNSPRLSAEDMVASIELYNHYVQKGDIQKSETALQNLAMSGTEIAQALQAMSIMNHLTPQGQAVWIQRSADKLNKSMLAKKKATLKTIDGQQRVIDKNGKDITNKTPLFKFTQEMQKKLQNSTKENMYDVLDDIYKEMGQQVPKSHMEQFDEWRYFSMLGNPKTHFRNILGNITMEGLRQGKNKLAGAIEDAYYSVTGKDGERNHTLRFADKKTKDFAKQDVKNREVQTMLGVTEDKYNPQSRLKQNQRTFKNNLFEKSIGKVFKGNTGLLSKEDASVLGIAGLEPAYKRSLAEYITANRLDVDTMTDKQLAKAREYAVTEAKEATFHTYNKIASIINTFESKNALTKVLVGGTVPFKQTPMNVAIQGFEYSPAGLLKTLTYDTVQLKNGNINANQYINKISKGLTGTGIALLGYGLTSAGILKASSGGDDKDDYEKSLGKQNYAIQIGDSTYSLDWLAPAGIPLFVGSELYQISKADAEEKKGGNVNQNEIAQSAENLFNAMTTAMNPMTEMTMLSGLTSVLKSYANDPAQALGNIIINTGKSYATQSVPTALGQIVRSADDKERSTTSTESNVFTKALDSTKNQIMSKLPGLRQMLPVATDVWGNEIEGKNYIENAILPANRKEVKTDKVDEAITKLYDETGESAVIPDTYIQKTLTLDKEKYRLTNEEYAQLKQQYGQTSHDLLEALTQSSDYGKLTNDQKVKAVKEVYSYVKASLKHTYADQNDIDAEDSSVYQKVQNVIQNGGDAKDYFKYIGLTNGMDKDKEKINALENSNIRNKGAIYESTIGKDDDKYKIMKNTGINDKAYLDYKQQKFESDKDDNGKTISGSAKNKFYDYMDDANMTYEQKLLLTGMNYTLLPGERDTLANYIESLPISASEKTDIYRHLKGAKVYDNGEIYY